MNDVVLKKSHGLIYESIKGHSIGDRPALSGTWR